MAKIPEALREADRPFEERLPGIAGAGVQGELAGAPEIRIQPQRVSLWCWSSVTQFVHAVFGTVHTQCTIAEKLFQTLEEGDCAALCKNPDDPAPEGGACNRFEDLEHVLQARGLLRDARKLDWVHTHRLPEVSQEVREEVDSGRPVCVRVGDQGGGHFVAISGWIEAGGQIRFEVMDPGAGEIRYMTAEQALHDYPCWGSSTHLYFTRRES